MYIVNISIDFHFLGFLLLFLALFDLYQLIIIYTISVEKNLLFKLSEFLNYTFIAIEFPKTNGIFDN